MLDAIVIGAGLAGLQAARSLQEAGLMVAVVEARDRVGGKVWSVPLASGRGVVDLGAAWVNDQTQPRISRYLERWNLERVEQRLGHTAIIQISEHEQLEFPYGITPDVNVPKSERYRDALLIQSSSLQQRRRTWSSSATIYKRSR